MLKVGVKKLFVDISTNKGATPVVNFYIAVKRRQNFPKIPKKYVLFRLIKIKEDIKFSICNIMMIILLELKLPNRSWTRTVYSSGDFSRQG